MNENEGKGYNEEDYNMIMKRLANAGTSNVIQNSEKYIIQNEEGFFDKLSRRFKKDPLVPIGAITTVGFLAFGMRSFFVGDKLTSQKMMRGRVIAQGCTILALVVGTFFGAKPHDRPKTQEEKMQR